MMLNYLKLQLPAIPTEICDFVKLEGNKRDPSEFVIPRNEPTDLYEWFPLPQEYMGWFHNHVTPDRHFGVQVIKGNLYLHQDRGSNVKFNYIVQQGNDDVETVFYDSYKNEVDSLLQVENCWYILCVQEWHSVRGLNAGNYRLSITSRIARNNRI